MSVTGQDILDLAVERSELNNASLVSPAQVLRYISKAEAAVYVRAAQRDTDYFGVSGTTTVRTSETESWNIHATPGNIAALTRVECNAVVGSPVCAGPGVPINLVRFTAPETSIAPRAYMRNRRLFGYLDELGADSSNYVSQLKLYYSPLPPVLTTLSQTLLLPDEWIDLVALPLARFLSIRDRRLDEAQLIDQEYVFNLQLFDEAVSTFFHGAPRHLGAIPGFGLLNRSTAGGSEQ